MTQLAIAGTSGRNLRTVSMPGLPVMPLRTFQSVVNGTPDALDSSCICAYESESKSDRTSAPLGSSWFIGREHIRFDTDVQSNSIGRRDYCGGVSIHAVIWANVETLMKRKYGHANLSRLGRDTGIKQGGAQRLQAQADVGVGLIERVAAFFKIDPWQLLAPELGESMLLTDRELEAVRKLREPVQPKQAPVELGGPHGTMMDSHLHPNGPKPRGKKRQG